MASQQCCENPPTLSSSCGAGTVGELRGLSTYVTCPPASHTNRAILLLSDVVGYEAPNLRKLADKVAESGYLVVVPDFFDRDYFKLDPDFDRQAWLSKHNMDKGCDDAQRVIAALRAKGVSSIGAAGFCWGGVVVVKLAKSVDYIQASVVLHPAPLTTDDINEIKVPVSILGAEVDECYTTEQLKQFEEILSAKSEIESFVKIYPGTTHGWTVRYDDNDQKAVERAEESHSDMLNWFLKFVK